MGTSGTDKIGTFGAHPGHDGHILGTLSAIQILVIQDALDRADIDRIVNCKYPLSPFPYFSLLSDITHSPTQDRNSPTCIDLVSLTG